MPKYRVAIGRPTDNGTIHQDVANFVSAAWKARFTDPDLTRLVAELVDIPVQRFPTDVARNVLVQTAKEHEIDILFMLDSDSSPTFDFFASAIKFLANQPTPSVIGCPYLSGDGECQVFRFLPGHSTDPQQPAWKLLRVPRPDAFVRTGIERVGSIGTHTIAYDMRVFDQIATPFFRYSYNADHTTLLETEEMYCHRNLSQQGVPIFVDWDRWSGHWKSQCVGPLAPIEPDAIPDFWKQQALDYFMYHDQGRQELEDAKAVTDIIVIE